MLPAYALTLTAEAPALPPSAADIRASSDFSGTASVELFSPHPDHADVPVFKDGPPPAAMLEVQADDPARLRQLAAALARHFGAWRAGLFRIDRQPVAGESEASPRDAGLSFVVRYFGPTADPAHFAAHYIANHPPILARFPRIRNVLCYTPLAEALPGFAADPCIIRNEVVFDNMADLTTALQSRVLPELRADSRTFAAFGRSTHHAMARRRLA